MRTDATQIYKKRVTRKHPQHSADVEIRGVGIVCIIRAR